MTDTISLLQVHEQLVIPEGFYLYSGHTAYNRNVLSKLFPHFLFSSQNFKLHANTLKKKYKLKEKPRLHVQISSFRYFLIK